MMFGLPDCDKVFMKYFDRWYSSEDRARRAFRATRPDMMTFADLRAMAPDQASPLVENAQADIKQTVDGMIEAAGKDWPTYLPVSRPIGIEWVEEFDRYHDKARVKALIKRSDPRGFSNDFLVTCCEFGAVLGHVLLSAQPNLHWLYDSPYWESSVFDPETGHVIPVFHWAIKKFSSYGIDDGFGAKLRHCSDVIRQERAGQSSA